MSDDWINDPYDEAPVHVLDDEGEPDDAPAGADDDPGDDDDPAIADPDEPRSDALNAPGTAESHGDSSDSA